MARRYDLRLADLHPTVSATISVNHLRAASVIQPPSRSAIIQLHLPYRRRLIGLQNYGNTCFCNVVLQGLLSCEEFCHYWLRRSSRFVNPKSEYRGTLAKAWTIFLQEVYSVEEKEPLSFYARSSTSGRPPEREWAPRSHREVVGSHRRLLELIRMYNPQFPINVQGDAHEFMQVLLKGLSTETHYPPLQTEKSTFETRQRLELNSVTEDMFRFHFVSRITCLRCGRARRRYEAEYEWSLDLPLPDQPESNLLSLLHSSANRHQTIMVNCSKCKSLQPSILTRKPLKLPDRYICVQIKRFAYSRDTQETYRLNTSIQLPASKCVDFGTYCSTKLKAEFELFGLTQQRGSLETGHYSGLYLVEHRMTLSHRQATPKWFCFSDERVMGVSDIGNEGDSVYLMWFRRRS